jgi:hypothetical protein
MFNFLSYQNNLSNINEEMKNNKIIHVFKNIKILKKYKKFINKFYFNRKIRNKNKKKLDLYIEINYNVLLAMYYSDINNINHKNIKSKLYTKGKNLMENMYKR